MLIDGVTNADSIPALERLVQFAGQRHRVLVNDIANLRTPGYRATDVSPEVFQAQLGEAIDRRRVDRGAAGGSLELESTDTITFETDRMTLQPTTTGDNLLFHDGTDADVERTMQRLVENFMTFRGAAELLRSRYELINTAIRERL